MELVNLTVTKCVRELSELKKSQIMAYLPVLS
jgi:hypothetical protein